MVNFHRNVINIVLLISTNPFAADGFAYAPNFITKIITEETGKEPVGLLEIPLKSENVEGESSQNDNDEKQSSVIVDGPVTTRFPPEPNGYLHLGHAKAVSFNFQVARMFPPTGRCNMRLDDTNPSKENQEYIDSILEDVRWIQSGKDPFPDSPIDDKKAENNGPWFGRVHKTSDNFQLIYDCARELIKSGDAYVDSLSADEMREMRGSLTEPGTNSPFRDRSVEENLDLFEKVSFTLRAKNVCYSHTRSKLELNPFLMNLTCMFSNLDARRKVQRRCAHCESQD